METKKNYTLKPDLKKCFNDGWNIMKDNFLSLFLVIIVMGIVLSPHSLANQKIDMLELKNIHGFFNMSKHPFGMTGGLLGSLYIILVAPVFMYGGKMIFIQSVRRIKPDFEYFIKGFKGNYLTIVLAYLLTTALVAIGLIVFIIPGIIIACRLVFVPYIVMDKKVDPIEAVELSWKMTKGHGWKIFFMSLLSFFIMILGVCLLLVGIIPAMIWILSSFAALYESVNIETTPSIIEPEIL
jgi:uncharacterized membrane protein